MLFGTLLIFTVSEFFTIIELGVVVAARRGVAMYVKSEIVVHVIGLDLGVYFDKICRTQKNFGAGMYKSSGIDCIQEFADVC